MDKCSCKEMAAVELMRDICKAEAPTKIGEFMKDPRAFILALYAECLKATSGS